jgi:hypothetical protein
MSLLKMSDKEKTKKFRGSACARTLANIQRRFPASDNYTKFIDVYTPIVVRYYPWIAPGYCMRHSNIQHVPTLQDRLRFTANHLAADINIPEMPRKNSRKNFRAYMLLLLYMIFPKLYYRLWRSFFLEVLFTSSVPVYRISIQLSHKTISVTCEGDVKILFVAFMRLVEIYALEQKIPCDRISNYLNKVVSKLYRPIDNEYINYWCKGKDELLGMGFSEVDVRLIKGGGPLHSRVPSPPKLVLRKTFDEGRYQDSGCIDGMKVEVVLRKAGQNLLPVIGTTIIKTPFNTFIKQSEELCVACSVVLDVTEDKPYRTATDGIVRLPHYNEQGVFDMSVFAFKTDNFPCDCNKNVCEQEYMCFNEEGEGDIQLDPPDPKLYKLLSMNLADFGDDG